MPFNHLSHSRSRSHRRRPSAMRRKKAKAKTKVDKRQDRLIKKLLRAPTILNYDNIRLTANCTSDLLTDGADPQMTKQIDKFDMPGIPQQPASSGSNPRQSEVSGYNLLSFHMKGVLNMGTTESTTEPTKACRIIVFWDNEPTYAGPVDQGSNVPTTVDNPIYWENLIANPDSTDATTTAAEYSIVNGFRQLVSPNLERFSILMDRVFTARSGSNQQVVKFSKYWSNLRCKGTTPGGEPTNRRLMIAYAGSGAYGSTSVPVLNYEARFRYTELQ